MGKVAKEQTCLLKEAHSKMQISDSPVCISVSCLFYPENRKEWETEPKGLVLWGRRLQAWPLLVVMPWGQGEFCWGFLTECKKHKKGNWSKHPEQKSICHCILPALLHPCKGDDPCNTSSLESGGSHRIAVCSLLWSLSYSYWNVTMG